MTLYSGHITGKRQDPVCRVEKAENELSIIINATETKINTNTSKTQSDGRKLEQADSFGYVGSTDNAYCKGQVKTRLAKGVAAMVKLTNMRTNKAYQSYD